MTKSAMLAGVIVTSCLLFSACTTTASSGKPFDAQAASGFVVGETTKEQAQSALGSPYSVSTGPDGTEMWLYQHTQVKSNRLEALGAAYGLNEYSLDQENSYLTLFFRDGILTDINSSQISQ